MGGEATTPVKNAVACTGTSVVFCSTSSARLQIRYGRGAAVRCATESATSAARLGFAVVICRVAVVS